MSRLILDGTWLIRRNFHAMGAEDNRDPGAVISSFVQSVSKLIRDYNYKREVIALFDYGKFRYRPKQEFPEYKANREYDEDYFAPLWEASNKIKDVLPAIGIRAISFYGLEADDLGYLLAHQGTDNILHSSDRDWYACVNDISSVRNPNDGLVDKAKLLEMTGLSDIKDYALYKSINGDGSDNIPR